MAGSDAKVGPEDQGAGLVLRPWADTDLHGLREAIDEDLGHLKPWLGWTLEEPASDEMTAERIAKWIREFQEGRGFRYAITPADRPTRILGGAGLNRRVGPSTFSVGYWVRRSAARRGIASAAVSALVVLAFEWQRADRLVIECDIANGVSSSFARALGFEPVGTATMAYPGGAPRPVYRFAMDRDAYQNRFAAPCHKRARRVRLAAGVAHPEPERHG